MGCVMKRIRRDDGGGLKKRFGSCWGRRRSFIHAKPEHPASVCRSLEPSIDQLSRCMNCGGVAGVRRAIRIPMCMVHLTVNCILIFALFRRALCIAARRSRSWNITIEGLSRHAISLQSVHRLHGGSLGRTRAPVVRKLSVCMDVLFPASALSAAHWP
jgi:hypothetical protein